MLTDQSRVVVLGAGGHGSEVYAYIRDLIRLGWGGAFLGFLDDSVAAGMHQTLPVLGSLAAFTQGPYDGVRYFTAVGDNAARLALVRRVEELPGTRMDAWTLIHPSAFVTGAEIGAGTLLAPGSLVHARSRVGRHCILNVKVSVSHDCEVGEFVNLNPGVTVCGRCRIDDGAFVGAGATVIERMHIGAGAIIGAGAVVVRDIPAHVTAVGVPARVIKAH